MGTLVAYLLVIVAGLLAIPVVVFCIEIVAAIALPPRQIPISSCQSVRRRLAVLVPAHNEGTGLLPTLADIKSQLIPGDLLLVIADNCADDTAVVARAGGAEVIERRDTAQLGKGYALDLGLRYLRLDPPEIVIFIDADCRVEHGTIDQLAWTSATTGQPVQALHIMTSPDKSQVNHQVAEFAGRVKLWLRQLGLSALRLPCMLMGTGMAFPWDVIHSADFTGGSIVEDLKLGLELSLVGYSPIFCPSACVTSEFPSSIKGARIQRKRWEQGHINMILNNALRLFSIAIVRRNWSLLGLTLDLAVPPLSLLAILVTGVFAVTTLAAVLGSSFAALTISTTTLLIFMVTIFLAWLKCGRDVLPASAILLIVPYVIGKLGLYRQVLAGKMDAQWHRTDRTKLE
jgi:cellulose synthase/poly-beta-1,6-N-acetylglucosamine synthase-like glycosyltransferase